MVFYDRTHRKAVPEVLSQKDASQALVNFLLPMKSEKIITF
jgi:hypothetical protein